ncbi:MFS general substrate transporter [Rhizoclosmatium globosum]|uniref:MFS general substrate transporter n=1 Tax=Rhizoclosmatium globosum TaxID=329046 RepID=A0A1Y2CMD4_9FUNG|nr:MFS general substrate transporter [Rhizoclosmatium globosum]|eukprot:ORY48172.1 MFS general substrate transporter [Rhizoclosmatium globosum]
MEVMRTCLASLWIKCRNGAEEQDTSLCYTEAENLLDAERGGSSRDEFLLDSWFMMTNPWMSGAFTDRNWRINDCIADIGMGTYQWRLFFLCGFGWFADNMWLQGVSVVIPGIRREFGLSESEMGVGSTFVFLGMMIGSAMWGILSDVIGRKPALLSPLDHFFVWVLGCQCAIISPFYWRLFWMGTGVGGNLPVDGSLFLEFIPSSHGNLMTLLSLFWPVGQLFTASIAWKLIPIGSCPSDLSSPCDISGGQNWAWRATLRILAVSTVAMVIARLLCVKMLESPKFLLSVGRPDDAERVLMDLGKVNGYEGQIPRLPRQVTASTNGYGVTIEEKQTFVQVIQRLYRDSHENVLLGSKLLLSLFEDETRKTTVLVFAIWSFISLGYTMFNGFLPIFLASTPDGSSPPISIDETYRNYFILAIMGIPGSIAGMYLIDTWMGRRGTMAASTFGTAAALFLFTFSRTPSFQLLCGCIVSVLQNCMYGVLYTYTPEVFESRVRGTANGAAASLSRVFGCFAPLLTGSLLAISMSVPLFLAAGLILSAAFCMLMLPLETRGRDVL